jgi:hypothetical protein
MAFKLIKQEKKKETTIDNSSFIAYLLDNHKSILNSRSKNVDLDNRSILDVREENKEEFDFFLDEKKEAKRKEAIEDIENSIINEPSKKDEQIVDRRKNRRK